MYAWLGIFALKIYIVYLYDSLMYLEASILVALFYSIITNLYNKFKILNEMLLKYKNIWLKKQIFQKDLMIKNVMNIRIYYFECSVNVERFNKIWGYSMLFLDGLVLTSLLGAVESFTRFQEIQDNLNLTTFTSVVFWITGYLVSTLFYREFRK